MFNDEILSFMKDNFFEDTKKVIKDFTVLQRDLDNLINNIIIESTQIAKSRNFNEAKDFLIKAEELSVISDTLSDYTKSFGNSLEEIDIAVDIPEPVDDSKENDYETLSASLEHTNIFTLSELLEVSNETLLNKEISFFMINNSKVPASTFKEVFINTLTFLGNLNKEKAYKLPQSTSLNSRTTVNFTFVKVKAMKEPVEIKELGMFVETSHDAKTLISLTNAVLQNYSIQPSELKIHFSA